MALRQGARNKSSFPCGLVPSGGLCTSGTALRAEVQNCPIGIATGKGVLQCWRPEKTTSSHGCPCQPDFLTRGECRLIASPVIRVFSPEGISLIGKLGRGEPFHQAQVIADSSRRFAGCQP